MWLRFEGIGGACTCVDGGAAVRSGRAWGEGAARGLPPLSPAAAAMPGGAALDDWDVRRLSLRSIANWISRSLTSRAWSAPLSRRSRTGIAIAPERAANPPEWRGAIDVPDSLLRHAEARARA